MSVEDTLPGAWSSRSGRIVSNVVTSLIVALQGTKPKQVTTAAVDASA